jgi:hypothetical protein
MGFKLKYFSLEEAQSLLPSIQKYMADAQETRVQIERKVEEWRKVQSNMTEAEEAIYRGQVDFLASRLEDQLGHITELGAVPKDLNLGLVDFPARVDSKEGYFCWKSGERTIEFWHGLTEGYQGRRQVER